MSDSRLYLGTVLERLADKLDEQLRQETAGGGDPFVPSTIIVPSADVRNWLQLFLARRQSVVLNLRIQYLESTLWDALKELTGIAYDPPVEPLDHERYRLLVLSILLNETATQPDLALLRTYLGEEGARPRDVCRRLWDLADRLARLIRDYEFHRQNEFIQKWLRNELALPRTDAAALERCQRALFHIITDAETGLRTRLSQRHNKAYKTLPQFGNEVMEGPLRPRGKWPAQLRERPIHLFGIAQISSYHVRILRWLSAHVPLRVYHINPLVSRVDAALGTRGTALQALRDFAHGGEFAAEGIAGDELLQPWSQAAAASLWRMSELLETRGPSEPFNVEVLSDASAGSDTLLRRVQSDVLRRGDAGQRAQDTSVQIVGCPGMFREVQTVYHSIIGNLLRDTDLLQSDIAVLAPNMELYRPAIQTVFDRDVHNPATAERAGPPIEYTLTDCSAAALSVFGQALLGMLDMALVGFPRTRVLDVLLNPCFLTRLGMEREQAAVWLEWAERLAVYHGWDRDGESAQDTPRSGKAGARLYTWRLALQRLRLGRIMETPGGAPNAPVPCYRGVVPYEDLESRDAGQLDAFCRAVEGLLPRLLEFAGTPARGSVWAGRVSRLVADFLDVPDDRADERQVRSSLLRSLGLLATLDAVGGERPLSLPLVREFVAAQLEGLSGRAGGLRGGVTISSLPSARPLPFKIIYVLGLGEGMFPLPDAGSPLDLRERTARLPGDIQESDSQRLQFLETLTAASQKLYLLYSCKELQKDQDLHPCSLVNRLRAYIEKHVLPKPGDGKMPEFRVIRVPLTSSDPRLLGAPADEPSTDVFESYSRSDRILALQEGLNAGQIAAGGNAERLRETVEKLGSAARTGRDVRTTAQAAEAQTPARVSIRELCGYLSNPAHGALKRHLRVQDEYEEEPSDDEPFYTEREQTRDLVQEVLSRFVSEAAAAPDGTPPDLDEEFTQTYENRRRQGQAPDGDFAAFDRTRLRLLLRERIAGSKGALAEFVRSRNDAAFCGPVQIGPSRIPIGGKTVFPALRLAVPAEALVSGTWGLAWRAEERFEALRILQGVGRDGPSADVLSRHLFEPVVFYLALLAGTEKNADGVSSCDWLKGRPLRITLAHEKGLTVYDYSGIQPDEARRWLEALTRDFLAARCFDLLPFRVIVDDPKLRAAYELPDGPELAAIENGYAARLQEAVDDDEDNDFQKDERVRLIDLLTLSVPADAFRKVRERFRLLDRGPAAKRSTTATEAEAEPTATTAKPRAARGKRKGG